MNIRHKHLSEEQLQTRIDGTLSRYPWFATYPVRCCLACAAAEILNNEGGTASKAWKDYADAVWLLTGTTPGLTYRG